MFLLNLSHRAYDTFIMRSTRCIFGFLYKDDVVSASNQNCVYFEHQLMKQPDILFTQQTYYGLFFNFSKFHQHADFYNGPFEC